MEIIKVLVASVSSAAVVTAGIAIIARPLAELARHLLTMHHRDSGPYAASARPAIR
jgi:hypothetical protein